jgi:hypothetical protein
MTESLRHHLIDLENLLRHGTQGEWIDRGGGAISAKRPQVGSAAGFDIQTALTPVAQTGAPDGCRYAAHGEKGHGDHDVELICAAVNSLQHLIDRIRLLEKELNPIREISPC